MSGFPGPGPTRRLVSASSSNSSSTAPVSAILHPDVDPPPKPWRSAQIFAFAVVLFFVWLQFLPASHFRDPSDPFRKWIPFDSNLSSSSNSRIPSLENSSIMSSQGREASMIHIVSWTDCMDLRLLAVLANSTYSVSRYPEHINFHFFIPEGHDEKLAYYKMKVLFPHSNIEVIGQKEIKDKLKISTSEGNYSWSSLQEIAPFIIPITHPYLKRFIYVSADIIMKGEVEELFGIDMTNYAIAAVEDCTKSLSSFVNFDVLDAIQRSAAKPWVSGRPYEKHYCVPDLNLLLVNANGLGKDLMEAILWWSKVLNKGSERNSQSNPAIVLALYNKYLKLSPTWKVHELNLPTAQNETKVIRFDGPKKVCSEQGKHDLQDSNFGNLWKQFLPPSSDRILGD